MSTMITSKLKYKICDAVHGFIRFGEAEKALIDSKPFQRLRYIRQMGCAFLVYPGATHTRFEHSLGVMELASRIFTTMAQPDALKALGIERSPEELVYWHTIVRLAALCHDLGHLPFSHTAEKALLPNGGHEKVTADLIQSPWLRPIWVSIKSDGRSVEEDILKISVSGLYACSDPWEGVLSQIITEDNFGADRIDYLIRDARATGVGYGHFDYHQLIDSLRILPFDERLKVGILERGIQSVESLWIARYLMYARVYLHPKAIAYSKHLERFMQNHYAKKGFPTTLDAFLEEGDHIILSALATAARVADEDALCLTLAKPAYKELSLDPYLTDNQLLRLEKTFGSQLFVDKNGDSRKKRDFIVLKEDQTIVSSKEVSSFLRDIPTGSKPVRAFAAPEIIEKVKHLLMEG